MRDIVIWGATGHAKVLHEALSRSDYRVVALVDNRMRSSPLVGVPVLHGEKGLRAWAASLPAPLADVAFGIAVGGDRGRDRIRLHYLMLNLGFTPVSIVHRASYVAADAVLGAGCQVLASATVCSHARIGEAVIINTSASVDHDTTVAQGAHVGPGATLAGEVSIGARAFVGAGAVVLPRISVGEDAIVGAGAVVTRDVPANSTVVGNPAAILRKPGGQ